MYEASYMLFPATFFQKQECRIPSGRDAGIKKGRNCDTHMGIDNVCVVFLRRDTLCKRHGPRVVHVAAHFCAATSQSLGK